ncbi:hypothetical protein FISHEDRAFT_46424 [Fistulina hepatica ATCC 64428]|uniref:Multicopper oxidase n=1 Tax=Fistulina hepatica ATCC 64428 TaxID=1128425 RepID=A0A0D7A932_9AGAR|nr:hypothetical protein FISHEDRAFT_46424 [Fistulina hepatica ATCC 64428]
MAGSANVEPEEIQLLADYEDAEQNEEPRSLGEFQSRRTKFVCRRYSGRWAPATAALVVVLTASLGLAVWLRSKGSLVPPDSLVDAAQFTLDPSFKVTATPRTREYFWTVTQIEAAPVGVNKTMLVVNGKSPGPIIEANSNDRIIVHVINGLEKESTHGLYQRDTNYYDGTPGVTQCGIPPGETLVYNFTLDGWVGTTWWHSHTDTQYTDGLVGPIVVHSVDEKVPTYDRELVVQLSDIYNTWSSVLAHNYLNDDSEEVAAEPVPDAATINGLGQFTACWAVPEHMCSGGSYFAFDAVQPQKTYRLRLINAGSMAPIHFSVDNHTLTVIEADGTAVRPVDVSEVMVHVGQRYSVLLKTDQTPDAYWMRARIDQRMFPYTNRALHDVALGVIRYAGVEAGLMPADTAAARASTLGLPPLSDSMLEPATVVPAPDASIRIPWKFSIQRTLFHNWRSFINNTSWEPLPRGHATLVDSLASGLGADGSHVLSGDQLITSFDSVRTVDFALDNLDDSDHPFHIHGYKPWIMGSGAGRYIGQDLNATNPMRRDTFNVPRFSWMVIRIVTDMPGYWALHCHLVWHNLGGGLFQIATLPSQMAQIQLPEDIVRHCAIERGDIQKPGR